ncbi:MAG: CYTH and CHAD domain-containing protein [Ornithinibacter sp.]
MYATRYEEIERKYAVDPDTALPAFGFVDAVAEVGLPAEAELEAVYFDTPHLDLLRHGITVRRRVGGHDQGWHLKQPSGQDARTETHLPLGRAVRTVPQRLREMVEHVIGSERLVPVAQVTTHRSERALFDSAGTRIATFCDDHVSAERLLKPSMLQRWREWEIELDGGHRELFEHIEPVIVAAGARPARASSKVARALAMPSRGDDKHPLRPDPPRRRSETTEVLHAYLLEQVSVLQEHDAGLRGGRVHQLRIAARRLRSVLASYQEVFEPGAVDPVREELRWLGVSLGAARDFEVLRRHLDAMLDDEFHEPAGLPATTLRQLIDHDLEQAHRTGHQAAMDAVSSPRYGRLLQMLQIVMGPISVRPQSKRARTMLPKILARDVRRVRCVAKQARDAAPGPQRDAALHEVRKKVKRLRYSAECAAPVLGKRASKLASRAKRLQEALGAHQDTVASRAWLEDLAKRSPDEVAFSAGRLHAREEQRARCAERDYEKALQQLPQHHINKWLRGKHN